MKNLFSCAPYAWSNDRTRKLLNKINKPNYNYKDWKFKPGKTCHFLVCGSINQFVPGFEQKNAGECWHGEECITGSVNDLVLNFIGSTKEVIAFDDTGQSYGGYFGEGLVRKAFGLFRTFRQYIWTLTYELCEALIRQAELLDQNSVGYQMNITTHIPPLILSELYTKEAGLPRKIIS